MADAKKPSLERVQALLRKERKFLRRAVAAHRDVQTMFDMLISPKVSATCPEAAPAEPTKAEV